MMFGFAVLTVVTVLTYTNAPPIPGRVVDPGGRLLFTGEETPLVFNGGERSR